MTTALTMAGGGEYRKGYELFCSGAAETLCRTARQRDGWRAANADAAAADTAAYIQACGGDGDVFLGSIEDDYECGLLTREKGR